MVHSEDRRTYEALSYNPFKGFRVKKNFGPPMWNNFHLEKKGRAEPVVCPLAQSSLAKISPGIKIS